MAPGEEDATPRLAGEGAHDPLGVHVRQPDLPVGRQRLFFITSCGLNKGIVIPSARTCLPEPATCHS